MSNNRLYHRDMYRFDKPAASWWEASAGSDPAVHASLSGDRQADTAIIGGGFTGLSAALHLARDFGVDARVIEAGHIGWGASGRNGGIVGVGGTKLPVETLRRQFGEAETIRFLRSQVEACEMVRDLAGSYDIDCDMAGNGEYGVAHSPKAYQELTRLHDFYHSAGLPVRLHPRDGFSRSHYQSNEQFGALQIHSGFGIHPLKFTRGLARAAVTHGVRIYTRSRVVEWRKDRGWHYLSTRSGTLKARRVIVCTGGYLDEGLHHALSGRILPVISNILVTDPIDESDLRSHAWRMDGPAWNTRELLYYFRMLPGNRFLFGARGDTKGSVKAGERMRRGLIKQMHQVFPAWRHVGIANFWNGFICVTRARRPAVSIMEGDKSIAYGFGYHGNGVNTGVFAGRALARLMVDEQAGNMSLPAVYRGGARRFIFPGLRKLTLNSALGWLRLTGR